MKPTPATKGQNQDSTSATARDAWAIMSDLVLEHERRREVSDALGLSFARIRAVRRVAKRPMSMKELAAALNIDPPNATTVVDDLETLGLARRRPHSTDRRAKLVEATPKGKAAARKAEEILFAPPPGLTALSADELEALRRLLRRAVDG
jgi:DNA-binding MarR family transcriptional regulator